MCIVHDQKFACGCWRKTEAELTHCIIARHNANPITNAPTPRPRELCKPAVRPSIWYCGDHAPCKMFSVNYEELKKNMSADALEHILKDGDYNFELKAPASSTSERNAPAKPVHEALYPDQARPGSGASSMKSGQEGMEVNEQTAANSRGKRTSSLAHPGQVRMPGGYLPYSPTAPGTAR